MTGLISELLAGITTVSEMVAAFQDEERCRRLLEAMVWPRGRICPVEVIWLLRHLKPDFKTIADFRRDNRNAFRPVFRQFVLLCRQLDLFGRELLAVDGTRIKAVNNKDRNFTRASLRKFLELADAKLDDYLQRLDQSHAAE